VDLALGVFHEDPVGDEAGSERVVRAVEDRARIHGGGGGHAHEDGVAKREREHRDRGR
jgi:hypothetical protein